MRFFRHSRLFLWGPRISPKNDGFWWLCEYTEGPTVGDPACVFWNHLAVGLKIGKLFLGGFEFMWG